MFYMSDGMQSDVPRIPRYTVGPRKHETWAPERSQGRGGITGKGHLHRNLT